MTTQTTVQSIVPRGHLDVTMEFAVQTVESVIITLQRENMNATVHQDGYLFLIVEDHITHVVVILVRTMEHVKLMELITFVIAFHVSF